MTKRNDAVMNLMLISNEIQMMMMIGRRLRKKRNDRNLKRHSLCVSLAVMNSSGSLQVRRIISRDLAYKSVVLWL
jgi:hypothetical protein